MGLISRVSSRTYRPTFYPTNLPTNLKCLFTEIQFQTTSSAPTLTQWNSSSTTPSWRSPPPTCEPTEESTKPSSEATLLLKAETKVELTIAPSPASTSS